MDNNVYTWKDIVLVNGKTYAEEFKISGKTDDGNFYQIDDFIDAVAKKYNVNSDDVKTYVMDNIEFDPKELEFGAESCGCYINGVAEWLIGLNNIIGINNKKQITFTWSDKEDPELYNNGIRLMWVVGRSTKIQKFVEALSYKIGSKCDFSFVAGRAYIDVFKHAYDKAIAVVNDEEFMKQFIVPYSKESYNNETYFEVLEYLSYEG